MNTAIALSGSPLRKTSPRPKAAPIRLLQSNQAPAASVRLAPAGTRPDAFVTREIVLLVALAIGLHALVLWGVRSGTSTPHLRKAPQEIELVRVPPPPKLELPKPPIPPAPKPEPPKAVAPPKSTAPPPPALRTAPAEAPQANTLTVPENLSASTTTGPVVAAAPAPAPAPKIEEPVTEANGAAAYLTNPPPSYPKAAQRLGLQGRVVLRVQVLASGKVGALEIKQSSGKPVLDEAALSAVKAWTFTPSKRGATPIDGWTNVPIEFRIAS